MVIKKILPKIRYEILTEDGDVFYEDIVKGTWKRLEEDGSLSDPTYIEDEINDSVKAKLFFDRVNHFIHTVEFF